MSTVIGIDLGGTKIDAALFDTASWNTLAEKRERTDAKSEFPQVFERVLQIVKELQKDDTTAIGIGVPGLVHQPDGIVLQMPNIPGAENFALKAQLQMKTGLLVTVENDAGCFTLAEALRGAGKGLPVVVGVTIGTGVGGGIVINGRIFHGHHGFAAEIGHMLLQPGHVPYKADNARGEVEQFLSGTAMGRRCEAAASPVEYLEGQVCSFMHPDLHREVAWMCVNLIHLLDPSVIIVGGSAGNAMKPHLPAVERELKNWLLPGTPIPPIRFGELKNAATLGAALLTV